jgi:hypothetical protein
LQNILIEYAPLPITDGICRIGNGPVGIWACETDSVVIQHCISYRNKTAEVLPMVAV